MEALKIPQSRLDAANDFSRKLTVIYLNDLARTRISQDKDLSQSMSKNVA